MARKDGADHGRERHGHDGHRGQEQHRVAQSKQVPWLGQRRDVSRHTAPLPPRRDQVCERQQEEGEHRRQRRGKQREAERQAPTSDR